MDPVLKAKLISTILDSVLAILGLGGAALIAVATRWIHQKTGKTKLTTAGGWLWDLAMNAVSTVSAGMAPSIKKAAADGQLSASDRAMLKADAMKLVKDWLGDHGLKTVKDTWGLAEPAIEAFLGGYIERALGDFKAKDVSNAPVLSVAAQP